MGIKGLHKTLEAFAENVEIGKFAGEKVAIDTYAWLHKVSQSPL